MTLYTDIIKNIIEFPTDYPDKNILLISLTDEMPHNFTDYTFNQLTIVRKDKLDNIKWENYNIVMHLTNSIKISRILEEKIQQYPNFILLDMSVDKKKFITNIIIPNITQHQQITQLYRENSFPLCMVNNYPRNPLHVIEWAKEQSQFGILHTNKILSSKEVVWSAYHLFKKFYEEDIIKLLETTEEKVWEDKLIPHPIKFDINNLNHLQFIQKFLNNKNHDMVKILSEEEPETKAEIEKHTRMFDIEWLDLLASLRCENYNIPKPTIEEITYWCQESKMDSEVVYVAIDVLILEMVKGLVQDQGLSQDSSHCNWQVDMEEEQFTKQEIDKLKKIQIGGRMVSCWDKYIYSQDTTLLEFKKYYEEYFNITITTIIRESEILYSDFMSSENLSNKLSDMGTSFQLMIMDENELDIPPIHIILQ